MIAPSPIVVPLVQPTPTTQPKVVPMILPVEVAPTAPTIKPAPVFDPPAPKPVTTPSKPTTFDFNPTLPTHPGIKNFTFGNLTPAQFWANQDAKDSDEEPPTRW